MQHLTELQERILSALEEPGEENVFTILNTVSNPEGQQKEVADFKAALLELLDRGHIDIGMEARPGQQSTILSEPERSRLAGNLVEWFAFDEQDNFWTITRNRQWSEPVPAIFLTNSGILAAQEVLERRGYQWWRPL